MCNMITARVKAASTAWGKLVGTLTSLGWKDRAMWLVLGDVFVSSTLLFGAPLWGSNVLQRDHDMAGTDVPILDALHRKQLR